MPSSRPVAVTTWTSPTCSFWISIRSPSQLQASMKRGRPPSVRRRGGARLRHALLVLRLGHVVFPGRDDVDTVLGRIANDAHRVLAVHDGLELLQIELAKLDDAVISKRQIVLVLAID